MVPFPEGRFLELHARLVATPGPSLQEAPRRAVLQAFFQEAGLPTCTDAAGNLWLSLGPEGWDDALVYDAHMDVVERGYAPDMRREGDRLIGLGVGDNLAAVTLLALWAAQVVEEGRELGRPLKLLFSVGEEGLGNLKGMRQMLADHPSPPYLLISFDGTLDKYSVAGLGSHRYRVEVGCPGGHSWGDYGAPNAIEELVEFLGLVKAAHADLAASEGEVISYNLGTIRGGEGINSIARTAEATFEFRSAAPSRLEEMARRLDPLLQRLRQRQDVSMALELLGERPAAQPVRPERIEPLVQRLLAKQGVAATASVRSTNINLPLSAGWPSICLGLCRSDKAHREDEYLDLSSLPQGWCFLEALSAALLG